MSECQVVAGKSLWEQMQQVHDLQQRTIKYLHIFQKANLMGSDANEFLDEPSLSKIQPFTQLFPEKSSRQGSNHCQLEQKKSEDELSVIAESQYIGVQQDIRLSRIFEQIHLGRQITAHDGMNTIEVQVWLQGEVIRLQLSRSDIYNLSNFSSFNNDKVKEEAQYEFRNLLENIQEQTGRSLTAGAVDKILFQMSLIVEQLQKDRRKREEEDINLDQQKTVKGSLIESVLTNNTQVDHAPHKYDNELNNYVFKKYKPHHQPNKSKQNALTKSIINGFQIEEAQEQTKVAKNNIALNNPSKKRLQHNKENLGESLVRPRTQVVNIKQLKIIRRNNQKWGAAMTYNSWRDIDNFSIVNKLTAREKEKICRAVQLGKTMLNLD